MTDLPRNARIVIGGHPRTGKTTHGNQLAAALGVTCQHTDDLIDLGWSEASAAAAEWMTKPGPWVIEGMAAARALRKVPESEHGPCDLLIWLTDPFEPLTKGQLAMGKGADTVLAGIVDALDDAQVQVRSRPLDL